MHDASLLITAWKRPRYLRRALASWAQVPETSGLRQTVIALGRSARDEQQREVIRLAGDGLGRVTVRPDSDAAAAANGMHRALGEAISAMFAEDPGLEFLVCSEEDIVVSDDVLRFMAWGRELRGKYPQILVVTAHNALGQGWHDPAFSDENADQDTVRLSPQFHPWTWGVWRDRWEQVLEPAWDWDCNKGGPADSGYDWQIGRVMQQGGYVAPAPDASRSQNIGRFEGWAQNPANFAQTQAKSFRETRGEVAYRLED